MYFVGLLSLSHFIIRMKQCKTCCIKATNSVKNFKGIHETNNLLALDKINNEDYLPWIIPV